MSQESQCQQELLSQDRCYQVTRCSCGAVHVTIGPITMRLEPEAYHSLLAVLLAARQHLPFPSTPQHARC